MLKPVNLFSIIYIVAIVFIVILTAFQLLRLSSLVLRLNQEPIQNFELNPLFNPRVNIVLIPFIVTEYQCLDISIPCDLPLVRRLNLSLPDVFTWNFGNL